MWVHCTYCNGTGKVGYGLMEPKFQCSVCQGIGSYEDGKIPEPRFPPPGARINTDTDTDGVLSSNKTFSALVGWVVAGYLFWKMYLAGTPENDWYFIGPIVAGCLATWLLRRADWLCTILRRMVMAAIFCGVLAAVYFFLKR